MFIRPTEFHLCIGEPDAQWHRLTSTMPKYGNSGTERSPHARSAFPRALGYPGSAPRGPTHSLWNSHTSFPPAFDAGETHAPNAAHSRTMISMKRWNDTGETHV